MSTKKVIIIILAAIIAVATIAFFIFRSETEIKEIEPVVVEREEVIEEPIAREKTIGYSVEGREIEVYKFGDGNNEILFVGAVHGGYEWNTVVLAYQMIDYFEANNEIIPDDLSVSIIPSLNPDGVYDVTGMDGRFEISDVPVVNEVGLGRFNANNVDLNRNFDCKWAPESSWRGNIVDAGTGPFSEPEAIALRDYVYGNNPEAVIFWHSKANTVYASECEEGVLTETVDIMNLYATAGQYNSVEVFDAYPITGDAEGWLASIGIPAITVELETHETIEFDRNLAGVKKMIEYYSSI
jgi:hypothetical protein